MALKRLLALCWRKISLGKPAQFITVFTLIFFKKSRSIAKRLLSRLFYDLDCLSLLFWCELTTGFVTYEVILLGFRLFENVHFFRGSSGFAWAWNGSVRAFSPVYSHTILGGFGYDYINGGADNDSLWEIDGDDTIYGKYGTDYILRWQ